MEEVLTDVPTKRRFAGIELISGRMTDETTNLSFRHLLENQRLGELVLETVKAHLSRRGMTMQQATIVDANLIEPSSTKKHERKLDPKMHQSKKCNQWYYGMNVHVGVDKVPGVNYVGGALNPIVLGQPPLPATARPSSICRG